MTDPRKGLPSASAFPRYALCPGSFMLERGQPEEQSEDAAFGSRVHEALAGKLQFVDLSVEELEMFHTCANLARDTVLQVLSGDPEKTLREVRLWLPDDDLAPLCSGQFDLYARRQNKVLILDYKTGRDEVIAEESWQLRTLAALATENCMVGDDDELTVGIVQPWTRPQVRLVVYSPQDRIDALAAVRALAVRVQRSGEPRVPSDAACKYCRAKPICPDAQAVIVYQANLALPDERTGEVLDGRKLAWLLDRCGQAKRNIASFEAYAKRVEAAKPGSIPGWHLREGALRETYIDLPTIFRRVQPLGVTAEIFTSACTLKKTVFKPIVREATGLRGKALDQKMAEVTEGCTESKRTAPQLERTGHPSTGSGQITEGNGEA